MKDGFIRVAAASPEVALADCSANAAAAVRLMRGCAADSVKLIVFPELFITGYTCGDLFLQRSLLESAEAALERLLLETADLDILAAVGIPVVSGAKLFNAAAVIKGGRILGVVPKTHVPNYTEYYECRHFSGAACAASDCVTLCGQTAPFGTDLVFCCSTVEGFTVGFELCEDLWVPGSPGERLALAGANIICNLSASNETISKRAYRRDLVRMQSARLLAGYVYASSGRGESTTDLVFSGHKIIAENGRILAENSAIFDQFSEYVTAEIDLQLLSHERRRLNTFAPETGFRQIAFSCSVERLDLRRTFSKTPFVPYPDELDGRCLEVLSLQAEGLMRRILHVKPRRLVIGVSGGLDSTLALLVSKTALEKAGRTAQDIVAITMPGPGTSARTRSNAATLVSALGAELRVVPITSEFESHMRAIGHSGAHDVAYENAQARERMQILMDVANMEGGIVVGTPDLSEIALGFSTYGGDHMSMYGVNSGVPKTLIRYLIAYVAGRSEGELRRVLLDIIDTPVSPELLPPEKDGDISQKTEKIIGDYILHDFILYYFVRYGFGRGKILRLMRAAFGCDYGEEELGRTLDIFFRRFFSNQFKRSCMPDGVKVGSVALSPRGDFRMPSDVGCICL